MDGYKFAKLLLLMMAFGLLLFTSTEGKAWWGGSRRRCSSSLPSGVAWKNQWHKSFTFNCPTSKPPYDH